MALKLSILRTMSYTSRVPEGFEATNFANTFATAVAAAVDQILLAQEQQPGNQKITFAISPALARTDILDYSTGLQAKIFSKATESLPTIFSIRNQASEFFSTNYRLDQKLTDGMISLT
jgi:hypothetical protein